MKKSSLRILTERIEITKKTLLKLEVKLALKNLVRYITIQIGVRGIHSGIFEGQIRDVIPGDLKKVNLNDDAIT